MFHGIVTNVSLNTINEYQEVTITGSTVTISDDLGIESAIFQDSTKTLSTVTALMTNVSSTLTDDLALPSILFQNKESNFSFARRIANENGQFLMVDCKNASNPVYIGNDSIASKTVDYSRELYVKKPIHKIEQLKFNVTTASSAQGFEFAETFLEIWNPSVGVGCEINYDNQDMLVVSSEISVVQGGLVNKIALVASNGQKPSGIYACHPTPRGFIVEGVVKTVQDNTVQVEFFTKSDTMEWLPYENTINNFCYAMPDTGDTVFVYHHPEDTGKNFAFSSKFEDDTHTDFNTYTTRSFTSENSMIQFEQAAMHLTGNKTEFESNQKECISFKDSGGIEITSSENVTLESEKDLIIFAGGSHSGMSTAMATMLAKSSVGYGMLLAGAGLAAGVPPVAIPSTEAAMSNMAASSASGMAGDLKSALSGMEETLTEGNTPTEKSEGKISVLSEKEVKLIVGATTLLISTSEFDMKSAVVMM